MQFGIYLIGGSLIMINVVLLAIGRALEGILHTLRGEEAE